MDETVISCCLQQPLTPPPTPPFVNPLERNSNSSSCRSSPSQSPTRTKLSIRRNFLQKRLENKERFKTQTVRESDFSPNASVDSLTLNSNFHFKLQKEADLVLKTLCATKASQDELLDCETLSLVSIDDDSEHNSTNSVNYRTYHKSLRSKLPSIPNTIVHSIKKNLNSSEEQTKTAGKPIGKPKIVKPKTSIITNVQVDESSKVVRGKRKPLYSKTSLSNKIPPKSIRPVKNVTSSLVKNVTSNIRSSNGLKPIVNKQTKSITSKSHTFSTRSVSGNQTSDHFSLTNSQSNTPTKASTVKGSPKRVPDGLGEAVLISSKGTSYFH